MSRKIYHGWYAVLTGQFIDKGMAYDVWDLARYRRTKTGKFVFVISNEVMSAHECWLVSRAIRRHSLRRIVKVPALGDRK